MKKYFLKGFFLAGWLLSIVLLAALVYLLPRLHLRILNPTANWETIIKQKQADLSAFQWADSRPLTLMIGDSHVETGSWYDLFDGTMALRNCGLSRATVADMEQLVKAIPDKAPRRIIFMCGINSIFRGLSTEKILQDYQSLLQKTRECLQPEEMVVIAVFPVRNNLFDKKTQEINVKVHQFNTELRVLCHENKIRFLDINHAITSEDGGLDCSLTSDGLHLNGMGYHQLANALSKKL